MLASRWQPLQSPCPCQHPSTLQERTCDSESLRQRTRSCRLLRIVFGGAVAPLPTSGATLAYLGSPQAKWLLAAQSVGQGACQPVAQERDRGGLKRRS